MFHVKHYCYVLDYNIWQCVNYLYLSSTHNIVILTLTRHTYILVFGAVNVSRETFT